MKKKKKKKLPGAVKKRLLLHTMFKKYEKKITASTCAFA